ncbi:MAG: hypothetical protein CM15mP102_00780 [Flavobacteriales bacterium]|nr:MAG: hypothetical protein CM15mP102_00780 [Flavobacteriales bacterium]
MHIYYPNRFKIFNFNRLVSLFYGDNFNSLSFKFFNGIYYILGIFPVNESDEPKAVFSIFGLSGVAVYPEIIIFSIKKESDVLKIDPHCECF